MTHNARFKKIIFVTSLVSVMVFPALLARGEVRIKTEVDKEEAILGDRINVDITLTGAKDMDVLFPDEPADTGDFSFIGSQEIESKRFGPKIHGRTYVFGIYETGTHVIPPIEVRYRTNPEEEWKMLTSRQIPVEVSSILKGDETDIRDIKGLGTFRTRRLLIATVAGIILFSGMLILWIFWRGKTGIFGEQKIAARPAHEIAYAELEKLRSMELPKQGRIKEYYIRLSDITRRYLENRFSYRAPEMTTEEFLNYLKNVSEIPREHKDLLKQFLTQCDMVKFAKYDHTPLEVLDSFKLSEKIVDQTKLVEENVSDEDKT